MNTCHSWERTEKTKKRNDYLMPRFELISASSYRISLTIEFAMCRTNWTPCCRSFAHGGAAGWKVLVRGFLCMLTDGAITTPSYVSQLNKRMVFLFQHRARYTIGWNTIGCTIRPSRQAMIHITARKTFSTLKCSLTSAISARNKSIYWSKSIWVISKKIRLSCPRRGM